MVSVELVDGAIDAEEVRRRVVRPEYGAVLVFHGVVRNHHDARPVAGIHYHAYREMAERELVAVAEAAAEKHRVGHLVVVHRLGRLAVGETSLLVAVGSAHRREAFAAGLEVIDRLKERVPIWKKEWGPDGERWVEGVRPPEPPAAG